MAGKNNIHTQFLTKGYKMARPSVFEVKDRLYAFGIWYALYLYGFRNMWTIFVASRMLKNNTRKF